MKKAASGAKKAAKTGTKVAKSTKGQKPPVFYKVNALLHTIRCIEQHEDQLCTILHEIQTSGRVSEEISGELQALLEEMPSSEYQGDLEALRAALER